MDRDQDKNQRPDNSGEQDKDLPGYPYYPPEEDIMNPKSGFKKIHADEELANSRRLSSMLINEKLHKGLPPEPTEIEGDLEKPRGSLSNHDLKVFGDKDNDPDLGDDELVPKARVDDLPNEQDLDVPGSDLDDLDEAMGEEDEENNYYSLGGDRHENLGTAASDGRLALAARRTASALVSVGASVPPGQAR